MLLKFTSRYRKLRRLLRYSRLDSHVEQTRYTAYVWVSRADNSKGRLSRQCRLSNIEAVVMEIGIVE